MGRMDTADRTGEIVMTEPNKEAAPTTSSTKITVKLSPRTMGALEQASKSVELNKTDTINRGIQIYAYLLAQADANGSVTIIKNGQQEHIRL